MGENMVTTLVDLLSTIERVSVNEYSAIVAVEPWTWGAEAMLVTLDENYRVPSQFVGVDVRYKYFLGVSDAIELMKFTSVKSMSQNAVAEFVIHYALYDAYPAWFSDLPDK
jgi:hypothetical protein